MKWPSKDPDEILDYVWTPTLDAGDHITTHTVDVVSGSVAVESSEDTNTAVTVWLSGGADGETAHVTLTATTMAGRHFEMTFTLEVISSATAFILKFKAAFPAFADLPNDTILFQFGNCPVDERFGERQDYASMLWVAHNLQMLGLGTGSVVAGVTEMKSGTLSVKFDRGTGFNATPYGLMLKPLMLAYCGSIVIADTGRIPC